MNIISIEEKSEMQIYKDIASLLDSFFIQNGFIVKSNSNYRCLDRNGNLALADSEGNLKSIFLSGEHSSFNVSIENVNDIIWTIRQWGQSTMQALRDNSVLMNFQNGKRYGWVSTYYNWDKETQTGTAEIEWRREIKVSLSFFKYRSKANIDYISADDVARRIYVWLQSDLGLSALREKGYEIYPMSNILNPTITIGDDKYERMPIFDITLVLKEKHTIDVTENFVKYTTMAEEFRQRKGIELISV